MYTAKSLKDITIEYAPNYYKYGVSDILINTKNDNFKNRILCYNENNVYIYATKKV